MFEDLAAASPDAIAVVCGEEQLTYGELNERANRVAHSIRDFYRLLHNLEMAPDTPIGIYVNQGIEHAGGVAWDSEGRRGLCAP